MAFEEDIKNFTNGTIAISSDMLLVTMLCLSIISFEWLYVPSRLSILVKRGHLTFCVYSFWGYSLAFADNGGVFIGTLKVWSTVNLYVK